MSARIGDISKRPIGPETVRAAIAFALILLYGLYIVPDDVKRVPGPVTAAVNPNVAEGAAWWEGRADLPKRVGEIVTLDGRHYNIYPPLVSIVAMAFHPITPDRIPVWWSAALFGAVLPLLALATFTRASQSPVAGAVLAAVYLFGSPLLPIILHVFRSGSVYHVNHAYSQIGLLLLLFEILGRRRGWVMGAGIVVAVWSRQLTILFAPAVLLSVWCGTGATPRADASRRYRDAAAFFAAMVIAIGALMWLNTLKFGNPLDTGYRHLDALRGSGFGPATDAGSVFSVRYAPRNLYYMHVAPPRAAWSHDRLIFDGNPYGTSIWLTMPILLYIAIDIRRIVRERDRLALLLAAAAVMAVQMLYFNTGYAQRGYSRFVLDFLPALLVVIGPSVGDHWRRFLTPVFAAWGLLYFGWLINQ